MVKKNSYRDLKENYKDYIIIQKAGCFYDVRDFGAEFFSKELGLKLYSDRVSNLKVGIPVPMIEKAIEKIKEFDYKYLLTQHYKITEKYDAGIPAPQMPQEENEADKYFNISQEQKEELKEKIKQYRNEISKKIEISQHPVFTDETIDSMTEELPVNFGELKKISGIGKSKLRAYGKDLIEIIRDFLNIPEDKFWPPQKSEDDEGENNEDFNKIVKYIQDGQNVFITGNAGSGKSYLLNKLKRKYKKLELTSTTGLAAINIKGVTIHSWAGVGICKKNIMWCYRDIMQKTNQVKRIKKCKLLAIDEISMLKGENFVYIDNILRLIKEVDKPFGGIQLLLFGDFFQLPPVEEEGSTKDFCFETKTWKELNLKVVQLKNIYRQNEPDFIRALNNIRVNRLRNEDIELLKTREVPFDDEDSQILHIFSKNSEADNYNRKKFSLLDAKTIQYKADFGVYRSESLIRANFTDRELMTLEIFKKNCRAVENLYLKDGCRVMLLVNLDFDRGLINGACGNVISQNSDSINVLFDNNHEASITPHRFEYYYKDKLAAIMLQYPLRLAYAITIHKSQGMTLDNVFVDCDKIFEQGQAYVALSRVRTLNGLHLKGFLPEKIKINPKVANFYANLQDD